MTNINITEVNITINLGRGPVLFDYIQNGVLITDQYSNTIYVNPAVTKITGYERSEIIGKNPGMFHSGQHDQPFYKAMWDSINTRGFWEGEIWNRRKSGIVFPELLTISKVYEIESDTVLYVANFSDISFLENSINKKLHLAFYDPLTELPNRNLYINRAAKTLANQKSKPSSCMVVFFMDLDKFKQVNDTYGHCVGDKVLKLVGKRLASMTREGDTIARIGGDEFAVIVTASCDKKTVMDFAKRIVSCVEQPFVIDGQHINISISIGISFYHDDIDNVDTMLEYADKAMYQAKTQGSKIECYEV